MSKYDNSKFRGEGNALYIVEYIKKELPPMAWNLIAIKLMKYLMKYKLRATSLTEKDEFPEEILTEINTILNKDFNKSLPIF